MEDYKPLFAIIAGLVLFLFALNKLSDHLKEVSGDKMKKVLDRFTSNLFTGILTGLIVTILLDYAHMLFNGLGVIIMIPFVHWLELLMKKLVPDRSLPAKHHKKSIEMAEV
jgi:Na+/phosphate symporter